MSLKKGTKNISLLKKIPVNLAEKNIIDNGIYKASDDGFDGYSEVNVNVGVIFTGSYDAEGLKTIGWSDEEIAYYNKYGVQWNESENDSFKLTDKELAGDDSSNTRFLPKNSTKTRFSYYYSLLAIPLINTSTETDIRNMFYYCYSLKTIPLLDTSKVTNMNSMFRSCYSLTAIPQLDTSEVTNMSYFAANCLALKEVPQLKANNIIKVETPFYYSDAIINFGGFLNLGQAYLTTQSANYSDYTLDISTSTALTEQSLINTLTNVYDIKTKGCNTQSIVLGKTNLAKLTSEEGQAALTQATTYGWSVS